MEKLGESIEGIKQVVAETKRACSKASIPPPGGFSLQGRCCSFKTHRAGGLFGHHREPSAVLPSRN